MRVTTTIAAIITAAVVTMAPAVSRAQADDAFSKAISAYGAKPGGELASAPKIRADGELYYLHGKIQLASEESPSFLASLSPSEENELLVKALRRSRGMGEITDYFAVIIPEQLQKYYFDNAKIGAGFDLIGRYTSNTKYKTVSGREMQAPVFEAVYFDLWSNRQPQAVATPQQTATASSAYEKCIDAAEGAMPDMIECSKKEAALQDARLNAAYQAAMAVISDKDGLRASQLQWIKARDQECSLDKEGGQAAVLAFYDCVATKTSRRAAELESIR